MNDKKTLLIKLGMKLFAEKGYHNTSIQEIATKAGISKGSFYLYFQSKEEFVVKALQFFHNEITKLIAGVHMKDIPARESFIRQINLLMNYTYEHRYVIIMHLQSDISLGNHAMELFQKIRADNFLWLEENFRAIYGKCINDYLFDVIVQFEGMMSGVFQWMIIDEVPFQRDNVGLYLMNRLDDMVQSMLQKKVSPLFHIGDLPKQYQKVIEEYKVEEKIKPILLKMQQVISEMDLEEEQRQELKQVTEIVIQKMKENERQNIIIQGLLAHFNQFPELYVYCKEIACLLEIELL